MIYCNHSSLMILVNDAKYIHFYPIFSTFSNPFTLQVAIAKPFIKSIEFCLFGYKYWVKPFSANIIINLSYNLSEYIQF